MKRNVSRRAFLTGAAGTLALTVGGTALTRCAASSNDGGSDRGTTVELDLNDPAHAALNTPGGAAKVAVNGQAKPVIVVRDSASQAVAFSSECTHQGCEVELPSGGVILCKCHGSQFDTTGKVTRGPAARDLPRFSASVQGDKIVLTV